MNLVPKNFFKNELTRSFQEIGGEPQKVKVTRYGYESGDKIYDVDILEKPIILNGKQLKETYAINCVTRAVKYTYYGGANKGMIVEVDGDINPIHGAIKKYFNL